MFQHRNNIVKVQGAKYDTGSNPNVLKVQGTFWCVNPLYNEAHFFFPQKLKLTNQI